MGLMHEASQRQQIIVTTQHPEVVKHAGLENIFLVSRDQGGFSRISRPADRQTDRQDIRVFLANDFGVDDLFVQNLLGG